MTSFHGAEADQVLLQDEQMRVSVNSVVDGQTAERLWAVVESGFARVNDESLLVQSMSEEELAADLNEDSILKFVYEQKTEDGWNVLGYAPVHTQPDTVGWVNQDALHDYFERTIESNTFVYVGVLTTEASLHGMGAGRVLTESLTRYITESLHNSGNEVYTGIDCCRMNDPRLLKFLTRCFDKQGLGLEIEPLAHHDWFVLGAHESDPEFDNIDQLEVVDDPLFRPPGVLSFADMPASDTVVALDDGATLFLQPGELGLFNEHAEADAAYLAGLTPLSDFSRITEMLGQVLDSNTRVLFDLPRPDMKAALLLRDFVAWAGAPQQLSHVDHQLYSVIKDKRG